jgi:hypothetical protein
MIWLLTPGKSTAQVTDYTVLEEPFYPLFHFAAIALMNRMG